MPDQNELKNLLNLRKTIIKTTLNNNMTSHDKCLIGYHLKQIRADWNSLCKIKGLPKSFYDYAKQLVNLGKASVCEMIMVSETFSDKGKIKPEFKDFAYSQLVEMYKMPDDMLKQITPNMSVRQIRLAHTGTAVISTKLVYKELNDIAGMLNKEKYETLLSVARNLAKLQAIENNGGTITDEEKTA